MPKIRSLKRSYFRSQTVKRMTRPARLTLAGIIAAMADDEGRFVADARLVRTEIYPWDDDVTDDEVESHLRQASSKSVALLRLYVVKGVRYGVFPKWMQHQWITKKTPSSIPARPLKSGKFRGILGNSGEFRPRARALDEGEGIRDRDEGKGEDDLFRKGKGALSKKRPRPGPEGEEPLNGDGHAAAVALLETTGILKRQGPTKEISL